MSDRMSPLPFENLLHWIAVEYRQHDSIFNIPAQKFFHMAGKNFVDLFGRKCELPIGPAAGPHTQIARNIVSAYLVGARFFELKTVQILDSLEFDKPCIDASDEGYNTEWSTELSIGQAYEEYVKAWFLIHVLKELLNISSGNDPGFIFNMSVGYDLKGISSPAVDGFIESLKDASNNDYFITCREILQKSLSSIFPGIDQNIIAQISPEISNSITLSTMHGCPPEEQEAICKYLLKEKSLHTYVKLNPTLLGYPMVRNILDDLGFADIRLNPESFRKDIQYSDAVKIIRNLKKTAEDNDLEFGVKLSNTLAVENDKGKLPGEEMYMSGRTLFPLTISLAAKLSEEFKGNLNISFAGGINVLNIAEVMKAGIKPVTIATDLLKPGGYTRLRQIAENLIRENTVNISGTMSFDLLNKLSREAVKDDPYRKQYRKTENMKIKKELPIFDCFLAPCQETCPIHQDVPRYISLIGSGEYEQALEVILAKNPLPHITGNICDHTCVLKCVRNDYEEPLLIRDLKKVAAEKGFEAFCRNKKRNPAPSGPQVAVIGAGPAGLSAGYFLASRGFKVTVFDKKDKPGGMVRFSIPHFRLPRKAIENDLKIIENTGVQYRFNYGSKFDIESLKKEGFKYIVIAIGAWKSRGLNLQKSDRQIKSAISFLLEFNQAPQKIRLGKSVAVVGGGNSAMDSARAALRVQGVNKVSIVYRRTIREMPADREELDNALKDGIEFRELLNPVSYLQGSLKCQRMMLGEEDDSGRKRPLPLKGQFEEIEADTVLSAIGETVDHDLLKANKIEQAKFNINERIEYETGITDVYLGGDALRGPSTVIEAIADGRNIADIITEKENGDVDDLSTLPRNSEAENRISVIQSRKGNIMPCSERLEQEENIGRESERCLECDLLCNKCIEVCPNRANIAIRIPQLGDFNQVLHLDYLCNECGNCETFCPYQGAPYKDKLTYFSTREDFEKSNNKGFFQDNNGFILIRHQGVHEFIFDRGKLKPVSSSQPKNKIMQNIIDSISVIYRDYTYLSAK